MCRTSLLSRLPPTVLSEVTEYCNGADIGHLWLCGCGKLNWDLSEGGGVRKFELKLDDLERMVWPKLLSQLGHLRDLHLKGYRGGSYASFSRQDMLSIPRKLKKLVATFVFDLDAFAAVLNQDPTLFHDLESLDVSFLERRTQEDPCPVLNSLPRNLTYLSVSFIKHSHLAGQSESRLSLEHLPPNLTSLDLRCNPLRLPYEGFQLPSSLTSLKVVAGNTPWVEMMPSSLLSCSIEGLEYQSEAETIATMAKLPRGLTLLRCFFPQMLTPELVLALPPQLTSLTMGWCLEEKAEEVASVLPRSLTFVDGIFRAPLRASIIKALPRSILKLPSSFIRWDGMQYLPKQEFLSLDPKTLFEDHTTAIPLHELSLPSSIRSLKIDYLDVKLAKHIASLPHLENIEVETFIDRNALPLLPHSLADFKIRADVLTDGTPSTKSELPAIWPKNVRSLNIWGSEGIPWTYETALALPQSLTELYTTYPAIYINAKSPIWFGGLPRSLRRLVLRMKGPLVTKMVLALSKAVPDLKELHIKFEGSRNMSADGGVFKLDWLAYLPRELHDLHIESIRWSKAEVANIEGLPPRLRHLSLIGWNLDKKQALPLLPRTLQRLHLLRHFQPSWFTPPLSLQDNTPLKTI